MKKLLVGAFAIGFGWIAGTAFADINYTQGVGTVIFDFICQTTKHCSAQVPIDRSGIEKATAANPFRVDPTGTTTQPVNCVSGCSGGSGGGGTSSDFGAAFPAAGTATGLSDGTNMVAARGDTTNGAWVNIKNSVALAVTGTFFQATQPVSAVSWPLPALAATSTKQSDGTQKTQIVDGSGNVIAATSNNLNVQCANCSGSGVSTADEASMTPGTSLFAGSGGFFQTTATANALTTGQQGMFQVTANRALFTNLRNAAGTEVGTSGAPIRTDPTGATTQPVSGTVTSNAGTNLNTSLLALETGGNLAQIVTDFGAPGATACATDTASCNQNQQLQRLAQRLTSIVTALGSPFQAGGSIGNTTFAVTGASGAFASGSFASGSHASGSFASGAFASGSVASGAMVDLGVQADAACGTATGTCSLIALQKFANTSLSGSIPAGAALIGKVGIDQTTPGTTNAVSATNLPTTVDTNSGNKSASTLRVVLATDQPALTNKLLVTPDANSAVNVSQINGATPLMGQGATGTGSPRVTLANDNTIPTGWPTAANQTSWQGATAAAPPANAVQIGANGSGATGGLMAGLIQCDSTAVYDASTNGSTELKALTSGRTIYVCGYSIFSAGTVNVKLIYGTGTACATGSNNMTPAYQLTAQTGLVDGSPFSRGLKTASANALCLNTSAGVAVQAIVYYSVI